MNIPEFVHIDLFSGIGGFALGFQKAGLNIVEHFFSEIDKNAINIYKNRFPKAKELGDVTTIRDLSDLRRACAGKIVIITFGFPCQDLSVAGKGAGLVGARSGLFFEAIRIVKELNPQYFIFENVKGLLTNNRGADFVRCLREIADIGLYDCEWQLVNTSWFLPQNRERVYFVGHLRGTSRPKVFPIRESNEEAVGLQRQCVEQYTKIRSASYIVEGQQFQKVKQINRTENNYQQDRVYSIDGISPCLNTLPGGNLQPKIVLETLDNIDIRKLTPLECERLQGFPDGWTEYGADGKKISDTARYKALGNAVSVPLPEIIGKKLLEGEPLCQAG